MCIYLHSMCSSWSSDRKARRCTDHPTHRYMQMCDFFLGSRPHDTRLIGLRLPPRLLSFVAYFIFLVIPHAYTAFLFPFFPFSFLFCVLSMAFNPTAALDYYCHLHTHESLVDQGWHFDISGKLVSPTGERYPIAESVIHSQTKGVIAMMPSTARPSDCGQSDNIVPGIERRLPPPQHQGRERSHRHRGRKVQLEQKPETSTSVPMSVQKKSESQENRLRPFSLSRRKSSSGTNSSNFNDGGGVRMAAAIAAEVCADHRRHSESCESHEDAQATTAEKKQRLYKTELCRNWQELDHCRYGDKCQYAHGLEDLRNVERHPKYKTQVCRTYYQTGSCPYGTRCTFLHLNEGSPRLPGPPSTSSSSSSSLSLSRSCSIIQLPAESTCLSLENSLLPTDAESLLPPGLLIDLDEPPPSFDIRPRMSTLLPCSPSNYQPFNACSKNKWKQPGRAATL